MKGGSNSLNKMGTDDLQNNDLIYRSEDNFPLVSNNRDVTIHNPIIVKDNNGYSQPIVVEESLSLQDKEIDMIKKALKKHKGKRKYASQELGISERTLYRKINEYNIEE
jgi:transcriptional regulator with PAS, ATPase and Fis domain